MKSWFRKSLICILAVALPLTIGFGLEGVRQAIAQVPGLFIVNPTGNEQINVLPPSTGALITSPQIVSMTVNQIRNSNGLILVPAGTTVTSNLTNAAGTVLATGAITTWNVVLPTAPEDMQAVKLGCPGGNVGTLSLTASAPSGVTIVGAAFTACTTASFTDAQYHYSLANNVWYRSE